MLKGCVIPIKEELFQLSISLTCQLMHILSKTLLRPKASVILSEARFVLVHIQLVLYIRTSFMSNEDHVQTLVLRSSDQPFSPLCHGSNVRWNCCCYSSWCNRLQSTIEKKEKIIHQRVYYDWLDKQANNGEEFRWGNFSFQLARRDRKANSRAHTQIHRWFMAYCTIFSCRKAKQWWMIMYIRRVSHQYLVNIFSLAKVTIWQKVFVNDGSGWLSRTQRSRAVGHRVLFSRTRRFGICSFHQRND